MTIESGSRDLKLGLPNSKGRDMQCGGEDWLPGVPSGSVFPDEVIGANPFTSVTSFLQ